MKKIIITQRLDENKSYFEIREQLDIQWGKLFKAINILPIIIPYEFGHAEYFKEIKIDGILLTGGNDLNSINANKLSYLRDNFESNLIQFAVENELPVFGICRGMQVIANFFGCNFKEVSEHVATRHPIHIHSKSRYGKYLNASGDVNSYHNYAINEVSDCLNVVAESKDGIIEAIEHTQHKIFGQMWHTERENPFVEDELNFLKGFFEG